MNPSPRSRRTDRASVRSAAATGAATARFDGRAVVVTGGASGIGRGIALAFAAAGANVTILDRDRANGLKVLRQLRRLNPSAEFRPLELGDARSIRALATLFRGRSGADILINNAAAVGSLTPFPDVTPAEVEAVLRGNLLGPYLLSQVAARGMISRGAPGTIINLLTIQTATPVPGYSAYVASKGGLEALTLSMAVELAPHGIRVNGIRVGAVLTETFLRVAPRALRQEARREKVDLGTVMDRRAATLVGRMGRPDEIARVALFLASPDASYVTGAVVRADGGRVLSRKAEQLV